MQVELDRRDIISLLRGSSPNFSVMDKMPKELGYYVGGFVDDWKWQLNTKVPYTDEYLYELYTICKNSWNENKED